MDDTPSPHNKKIFIALRESGAKKGDEERVKKSGGAGERERRRRMERSVENVEKKNWRLDETEKLKLDFFFFSRS